MRTTAPRRTGEFIDLLAVRDVDKFNGAQPPMTVAVYMSLNGRYNATFFDADHWDEMRYEV